MRKIYTAGYKEQAVQKALSRGAMNLKAIAQELEIGYSTLQTWIRHYKNMNSKTTQKESQRPQDWASEDRFQALLDTGVMDAEQRSQYCREKGLFPHHLDEWRQVFLQAQKTVHSQADKVELKSLKEEIKQLQKQIRRKNAALAETAALLVLQKKFQALLEEKED